MAVVTHDVLIPLRFLSLIGCFFAALIALYAVRDNSLVSLPYEYAEEDLQGKMYIARAAMYTLFFFQALNAFNFLTGFSTFDTTAGLFHLTMHSVTGVLLALTVINKGHYLYLWYIVLVFGAPQFFVDAWMLLKTLVVGGKRR